MAIEAREEGIAPQASGPRKIIHIDMDAFYGVSQYEELAASAEVRARE